MELWFLMPNYTAARSPSCNYRQSIKNWKKAAGTGPWVSPAEWVAGSSVVLHWNFPKAYFFLLPQQVDALNQEVLKKTFCMWKSHIYFYVLHWHFKWNLWSCFLCFFSSIFCSFRLKVGNCSKSKTKPFWGHGLLVCKWSKKKIFSCVLESIPLSENQFLLLIHFSL